MIKKDNFIVVISILTIVVVLGMSSPLKLDWLTVKKYIWTRVQETCCWLQKSKREKVLAPKELKSISCADYHNWEALLKEVDYHLEAEQIKIPNWKITKLPTNLHQIKDINKKKQIFLSLVMIGAYHANRRLLRNRARLKQVSNKYLTSKQLAEDQQEWLTDKFATYRIQASSRDSKIKELKRKLDIIPLSLVLAQAACESGWGTSRFARQGNNIFGEWTFSSEDEGLVPKDRPAGADYKIEKFSTVQAAIDSYLLNLNSHPAYKKLRTLRLHCRQQEELITGLKLLPGLINYSEEGKLYINKLKKIIQTNNLVNYDKLLWLPEEE